MKKLLLAGFLTLGMSVSALAGVTLDTGNFTVKYSEPTTNADGTTLQDLSHTTIYYSLNGAERIKAVEIPASSGEGGGVIQHTFTIDGLGDQVDIGVIYTASDLSGNESEEFTEAIIRVDKVPPSPPAGS